MFRSLYLHQASGTVSDGILGGEKETCFIKNWMSLRLIIYDKMFN